MRTLIFSFLLITFGFSISTTAQDTDPLVISGQVLDQDDESIPFANVLLKQGDLFVKGANTDFDGFFEIKGFAPGTYTLEVQYFGLITYVSDPIEIKSNKLDWKINMKEDIIIECHWYGPFIDLSPTFNLSDPWSGSMFIDNDLQGNPTRP